MALSEAADRPGTFVPHSFNEQLVDLGEIRMNYVAEGDPSSPALLLIPGQSNSWWNYEKAIDLLRETFHVFAIDLRGQGRSTWTPGRYTLDNFGNDVVRFIDLVIGRPTVVAGNSSGGVITAWLAAYAKPGQLRGAILEDPPLFASQATPPYGPGLAQGVGSVIAMYAKWLGDQWSIGDWEGMIKAQPDELTPFLLRSLTTMLGDGTRHGKAATVPQSIKEYDPEWARSFVTGAASAACDHATMLAQMKVPTLLTHHFHTVDPETGQLVGAMTDIQAQQARRIIESTGQPVAFAPLSDAVHAMHKHDAQRYVDTITEWIKTL
ncbi:alpha/beta fold hydrolase [Streptomyces sp. NPDC050355]|uniref:alpha/beta fold hydrolase n=1 Tax=Streptomyces sp. NPDC050355 TaxID=3365609 RepID=UPI00378C4CC9